MKQTFTLTQMQKNAILVAEESYSIDASGGRLDFEVNTNVDFRVELSETWIRQTTSPSVRGLVGRTLHFIIDPNPTTEPREATILLVADDVEQTITIRQQARDDMSRLHITHTNPTFRVPYIFGEEFVPGTVSWGDGTEEEYVFSCSVAALLAETAQTDRDASSAACRGRCSACVVSVHPLRPHQAAGWDLSHI